MFIDLQHMPPEGRRVEIDVAGDSLLADTRDFRPVDRVRLEGRVDRVEDEAFRFGGKFSASVEIDCVRCLEPFRMEIGEILDLLFLPFSANVGPGPDDEERELNAEDLAASFYRDERIELAQLLQEQVYLALPMKPLCRTDCQGLCPECGTNRNLSTCDCVRETADPRLAILKTLLKP